MLRVSRSGYYAWRRRPESQRTKENRLLLLQIKSIHQEKYKSCYGSPRVHEQLIVRGYSCSENRVARLMRVSGIKAIGKRKFRVTTDSNHNKPIAPNILSRDFKAIAPNQKWAGDITYIWTCEGWVYLAFVLDLFSRMVVGWSMNKRMTSELVCKALRAAIANRLPISDKPLMHSDRGSQYASKDNQRILKAYGITCSMSRKGNCWDNSVSESFIASLKAECAYQQQLETRAYAKTELFDYIERFYNRERFHSTLGNTSPAEFEKRYYDSLTIAA